MHATLLLYATSHRSHAAPVQKPCSASAKHRHTGLAGTDTSHSPRREHGGEPGHAMSHAAPAYPRSQAHCAAPDDALAKHLPSPEHGAPLPPDPRGHGSVQLGPVTLDRHDPQSGGAKPPEHVHCADPAVPSLHDPCPLHWFGHCREQSG